MPEDTVTILTAITSMRDHIDSKIDTLHNRISNLRDEVHQLDKRLQHIESTCQPVRKDDGAEYGRVTNALVLLATTYPRAFIIILLSLISGYPILEAVQSFILELANASQ